MSSVLSAVSQIPRSANAFIAVGASPATNQARFFSEAEFATAIATGSTVSGTQVFFATNTLANTAMVVAGADTSCRLVQYQLFKDLGKNYLLYTPIDSASGSVFGSQARSRCHQSACAGRSGLLPGCGRLFRRDGTLHVQPDFDVLFADYVPELWLY